jgi:hypothetical protein
MLQLARCSSPSSCIAMDASDGEVENVVESNRCTISLVSVSELYQLRESVTRARKFERSIIE